LMSVTGARFTTLSIGITLSVLLSFIREVY